MFMFEHTKSSDIFFVIRLLKNPLFVLANFCHLDSPCPCPLRSPFWTVFFIGGVAKLAFCLSNSSSSNLWISILRTAKKNVCAKNQWATSTTIANTQNWVTAPAPVLPANTAMVPRIELYETTLRVFEVPACDSPSAMRCLTGSVTEVRVTASTKLNIFSAPTNTITIGSNSLQKC